MMTCSLSEELRTRSGTAYTPFLKMQQCCHSGLTGGSIVAQGKSERM